MRIAAVIALALPLVAQEPLLRIPPARTSVEVDREPIAITASGAVWKGAKPDSYTLSLSADLSDLQAHVTDILRAHLDRNEPCGERIAIQRAALVPAQPVAVLTAEMHFERWACMKALGKTINKRLVAGDGVVPVKLTPVLENSTRARLDAEVGEIQADGTLGELLRSGSLGESLREKIRSSVQSALDKATDFRATLPPVLQDLVRLRSLHFADGGAGRLVLTLDAEAVISVAQMQQLRGSLKR